MKSQMNRSLLAIAVLATGLTAQANAGHMGVGQTRDSASSRVVYKVVQATPQYKLRRPEVISGTRVTLFANFLLHEPGYVFFILNGTTTQCTIVEWRPDSVTVELPWLGLAEPKNATLQIVLPDGRIAKSRKVLFVSQPDIVTHAETVGQPSPPAPAARPVTYVRPIRGGFSIRAALN